jgi:hypothetical protein
LIRGDTFLVLNFSFHILDGVGWLDIKADGLSCEGLHEDLQLTSSESEDQVEGRFLLDIVVRKCPSVFQ